MSEKRNVTSDWWLAMPATVEPKVLEWQGKYPDLLDVCYKTQYTYASS